MPGRAPADPRAGGAARGAARLPAAARLELARRDPAPAGRVPRARRPLRSSRCPSPRSCDATCPALRRAGGARARSTRSSACPCTAAGSSTTREEARAFPTGDAAARGLRGVRVRHQHRLRPVAAGLLGLATRRRRASRRASSSSCASSPRRWIERYDLRGKQVLEIGSGKGEFLVADGASSASAAGSGSTPASCRSASTGEAAERARVHPGPLLGARTADLTGDAVVCRHTLEHIQPVARRSCG